MPTANFAAYDAIANTVITAADFNSFLRALETLLNGLDSDNVSSSGFGAAAHGDLRSSKTISQVGHAAVICAIDDAGSIITSTNVEGALQENRTAIDAIEAQIAASGGAINAKYGVQMVKGGTTTGIIADFDSPTQEFYLPTASGEIFQYWDLDESSLVHTFKFGVKFDLAAPEAFTFKLSGGSPATLGLWIRVNGTLEHTVTFNATGVASCTQENGGTASTTGSTLYIGTLVTSSIAAADDTTVEIIGYSGNPTSQYRITLTSTYLDSANISNIRPLL
jgi:hypothetical protein